MNQPTMVDYGSDYAAPADGHRYISIIIDAASIVIAFRFDRWCAVRNCLGTESAIM